MDLWRSGIELVGSTPLVEVRGEERGGGLNRLVRGLTGKMASEADTASNTHYTD